MTTTHGPVVLTRMPKALPLTRTTFAKLLRPLDEETFAAFVADIWLKMDWETSVEDSTVTASRSDPREETRRLRVMTDERSRFERVLGRGGEVPDLTGIDTLVVGYPATETVVAAAEEAGVEVIDSDDLYDRLLYAVDRTTCRSLCRRHLGRAVEPVPPSQYAGSRHRVRLERLVERSRANRRAIAGAAATIVIVVALATIGVIGTGGGQVIEPGEGRVPTDVANPPSPVAAGSSESIVDTPPPTPTPDRVQRLVNDPSTDLPEEFYFRGPNDAVYAFIDAISRNEGTDDRGIRVAWLMVDPDLRLSYSRFTQEVRDGEYSLLQDPTRVRVQPDTNPTEAAGNGSGVRRYATVMEGSVRATYGFTILCRERNATDGRCWQIVEVINLSPGSVR